MKNKLILIFTAFVLVGPMFYETHNVEPSYLDISLNPAAFF